MKKILIIPISILLLTACATVKTPSLQTQSQEEQKVTQEELKVETLESPIGDITKEEKTSDGWTKSGNPDLVVSYTDKDVSLKGKVVEQEYYSELKSFFSVSNESLKKLPLEVSKQIAQKDSLKYFTLYFDGQDVTNNYKNKELTVTPQSIGLFGEGAPRLTLKQLP